LLCRIFGFLLGVTAAGAASYFYVYEEYKVTNDLLTEDIDVCSLPHPQHEPTADEKCRTFGWRFSGWSSTCVRLRSRLLTRLLRRRRARNKRCALGRKRMMEKK
jgi:hypothetical protein